LGCVTMDAEMRKSPTLKGFSNRFHKKMRFRLESPWLLPRSGDYIFKEVIPIAGESNNSLKFLFLLRYVRKLFEMSHANNQDQQFTTEVHTTLIKVMNMVGSTTALFAPKIFIGAIRHHFFHKH